MRSISFFFLLLACFCLGKSVWAEPPDEVEMRRTLYEWRSVPEVVDKAVAFLSKKAPQRRDVPYAELRQQIIKRLNDLYSPYSQNPPHLAVQKAYLQILNDGLCDALPDGMAIRFAIAQAVSQHQGAWPQFLPALLRASPVEAELLTRGAVVNRPLNRVLSEWSDRSQEEVLGAYLRMAYLLESQNKHDVAEHILFPLRWVYGNREKKLESVLPRLLLHEDPVLRAGARLFLKSYNSPQMEATFARHLAAHTPSFMEKSEIQKSQEGWKTLGIPEHIFGPDQVSLLARRALAELSGKTPPPLEPPKAVSAQNPPSARRGKRRKRTRVQEPEPPALSLVESSKGHLMFVKDPKRNQVTLRIPGELIRHLQASADQSTPALLQEFEERLPEGSWIRFPRDSEGMFYFYPDGEPFNDIPLDERHQGRADAWRHPWRDKVAFHQFPAGEGARLTPANLQSAVRERCSFDDLIVDEGGSAAPKSE